MRAHWAAEWPLGMIAKSQHIERIQVETDVRGCGGARRPPLPAVADSSDRVLGAVRGFGEVTSGSAEA